MTQKSKHLKCGVILAALFLVLLTFGCKPGGGSESPADDFVVDLNGTTIRFCYCPPGEVLLVDSIEGDGEFVHVDTPFLMMETELTIEMYEKLREISTDLPPLNELNVRCPPLGKNNIGSPQIPVHGLIPDVNEKSERRQTEDDLKLANAIASALTEYCWQHGIAKGKFVHSPDLKAGFRLPTDYEWQYACRATDNPEEARLYKHVGKLKDADNFALSGDEELPWTEIIKKFRKNIPNDTKGPGLIVDMEKYWPQIWNENFREEWGTYTGSPSQLFMICEQQAKLAFSNPDVKIENIVKRIPKMFLQYYFFPQIPECADVYLYDSTLFAAATTERPNAWGFYDMSCNVPEIVTNVSGGYSLMGGRFNAAISGEQWREFLIWHKTPPEQITKHHIPGIRLVIPVK